MLTLDIITFRALQYGGFTVTPVIGSFLAYVGYYHKVSVFDAIEINEITLPALFVGLLACIAIVILQGYAVEDTQYRRIIEVEPEEQHLIDEIKEGSSVRVQLFKVIYNLPPLTFS